MTLCQVCFTGADTTMRESLNAGIGVLLVVTELVLAAFARFFMRLARRSREAAHLVDVRPPRADVHDLSAVALAKAEETAH